MNFHKHQCCHICLFLYCVTILSGCGDEGRATVYPTSGVVLFDGTPMTGGGAISFIPLTPLEGKAAGGVIKEDGTFVMSTYADGDGSIAGEFRVTIHQTTMKEPETSPDDEGAETKNAEPTQIVKENALIPRIYSDPVKSPLTVKVNPDGQNESLNIELKRM